MPRHQEEELAIDSGARIDTYNEDDDVNDYGEDDEEGLGARRGFGELADEDKLSVNMDDIEDNDSDEDIIDLGNGGKGAAAKQRTAPHDTEETKYESNANENSSTGGSSGGSGGKASTSNLFAVGESQDKGLADMETGSEVYMSELLVSRGLFERSDRVVCVGWLRHGGL